MPLLNWNGCFNRGAHTFALPVLSCVISQLNLQFQLARCHT